jgi:hypothetical protein
VKRCPDEPDAVIPHVRICGSPGWATAQGDPAELQPKGVSFDDGSTSRAWMGDEGEIVVDFDKQGAVQRKRFIGVWPPPEPWTDNITRWLGHPSTSASQRRPSPTPPTDGAAPLPAP